MSEIDVSHFVYKPPEYQRKFGFGFTSDQCRATASDNWLGHQCRRRPVETIGGYGFCKQHAKEVHKFIERQKEPPHA